MFTNAIVRLPSKSMVDGLTEASLGLPNYQLACQQHADYVNALKKCGLDVTVLEAIDEHPDGCFVEDVALFTPKCAILTRPGAQSRQGEVRHIEDAVRATNRSIETIEAPGTIEAGDIMMVSNHYYIGLSERTNTAGAGQMISLLEKYGMSGSFIEMSEMLHLKTGLSYLEENNLLACGEFVSHPEFQKYELTEIPMKNSYSANSVWINGTVLVPAGFPETTAIIKKMNYTVIELSMSEFQKLDGGLSCLSLRF